MKQSVTLIIAGATGLVGRATLDQALKCDSIKHIYSLSRRSIELEHKKLTQWVSKSLTPAKLKSETTKVGVICLGSTIKKAGSQAKLHEIDVELVLNVAKQMQALEVQHLIVVSCIGASIKAHSHYLRCKGEMETALQVLDIPEITFLQPGPLAGPRQEERKDEQLLQFVMKLISPLMRGKLANYKLIESLDIAHAIILLATEPENKQQAQHSDKKIKRMTTSQMQRLIIRNDADRNLSK